MNGGRRHVPFGSVDRPKGRTSKFKCGSMERFTSMSSDLPCRLATVRSSGMRMLISDRSSAYSFACSLRLRQTISNASCMYIVAELLLRNKMCQTSLGDTKRSIWYMARTRRSWCTGVPRRLRCLECGCVGISVGLMGYTTRGRSSCSASTGAVRWRWCSERVWRQ